MLVTATSYATRTRCVFDATRPAVAMGKQSAWSLTNDHIGRQRAFGGASPG